MNPNDDRVGTAEAAAMLGLSIPSIFVLARRNGWKWDRSRGRKRWYERADIEAELERREAETAKSEAVGKVRVSPKDLAIAEKCARLVREYWAKRGYTVHVEAVGVEIVSDMLNGLPVR